MRSRIRVTLSGFIAAGVILAGGWFAGAFAINTGNINWLQFKSNGVDLCGVDRGSLNLNDDPSVRAAASERAYNRSGTTCTTTHGRPAAYVRVHLYLLNAAGSEIYHNWSDNVSGGYEAELDITGAALTNCYNVAASGREYDSDVGGLRDDIKRYTGLLCHT